MKYVVKKQKKRGRYIVFKVPDEGRWRICKNFKTSTEADKYVKAHKKK
jgi:hypothetical protein